MNFLKANRLSLLALFVMTSISLLLFSDLPAELPYGFKWSGEVRGLLPKAIMVFMMPMVFLFMILGINLMISFSPQKILSAKQQTSHGHYAVWSGHTVEFPALRHVDE